MQYLLQLRADGSPFIVHSRYPYFAQIYSSPASYL